MTTTEHHKNNDLKKTNQYVFYFLVMVSTFSIAASEFAIILLYLVHVKDFFQKIQKSRIQFEFYFFLIFIATVLISSLVNPYEQNPLESLRSHYRLFLPFVLYFAIRSADMMLAFRYFFGALGIVACYGIVQYFTGWDLFRSAENSVSAPYLDPATHLPTGFFHGKGNYTHHLTFAGVLLLSLPLALNLCLEKFLKLKDRLFYLGITIVLFGGLLASLSRGAWLGFAIGSCCLIYRIKKRVLISLVLCSALLLTVLSFSESVHDFAIVKRLKSGFDLSANMDRLLMWKSSWLAIQDHFWFGIGYDNDSHVMESYRQKVVQDTPHSFYNATSAGVHNIYLQTFLNMGVVGFTAYLLLWGVILSLPFREVPNVPEVRARVFGIVAGIVSFLVAGFFENNFRDGEVQIVALVMVAIILYSCKPPLTRKLD